MQHSRATVLGKFYRLPRPLIGTENQCYYIVLNIINWKTCLFCRKAGSCRKTSLWYSLCDSRSTWEDKYCIKHYGNDNLSKWVL